VFEYNDISNIMAFVPEGVRLLLLLLLLLFSVVVVVGGGGCGGVGGGGCDGVGGGGAEPICGPFDLTVVLKFRNKKTDLKNICICTSYLSENYGNRVTSPWIK
jgi:hypothetical protein